MSDSSWFYSSLKEDFLAGRYKNCIKRIEEWGLDCSDVHISEIYIASCLFLKDYSIADRQLIAVLRSEKELINFTLGCIEHYGRAGRLSVLVSSLFSLRPIDASFSKLQSLIDFLESVKRSEYFPIVLGGCLRAKEYSESLVAKLVSKELYSIALDVLRVSSASEKDSRFGPMYIQCFLALSRKVEAIRVFDHYKTDADVYLLKKMLSVALDVGDFSKADEFYKLLIGVDAVHANGFEGHRYKIKVLGWRPDSLESVQSGELFYRLVRFYLDSISTPEMTSFVSSRVSGSSDYYEKAMYKFGLASFMFLKSDIEGYQSEVDSANALHRTCYESFGSNFDWNSYSLSLLDSVRFHNRVEAVELSGNGSAPVFVVGAPRSGTSLIASIIGAHAECHNVGESEALESVVREFYSKYSLGFRSPVGGLVADFRTAYVNAVGSDAPVIVDKMPHNFQHVGIILKMIPEAKVVFCNRDPIDTILSIYDKPFPLGHSYSTSMNDIAEFVGSVHELSEFWSKLFPDRVRKFEFSELKKDKEHAVQQLMGFLGLSYSCEVASRLSGGDSGVTNTFSAEQVKKNIGDGATDWSACKRLRELANECWRSRRMLINNPEMLAVGD